MSSVPSIATMQKLHAIAVSKLGADIANRLPFRAAAEVLELNVPKYTKSHEMRDEILRFMRAVYERDGIPDAVIAVARAWYQRDNRTAWITTIQLDKEK